MMDPILTLLGFAQKAGKTVLGQEGILWHAKTKTLRLVILAEDADGKKTKDTELLAEKYDVSLIRHSTLEKLGRSVGRRLSGAIALTDQHFADVILKHKDGREKK